MINNVCGSRSLVENVEDVGRTEYVEVTIDESYTIQALSIDRFTRNFVLPRSQIYEIMAVIRKLISFIQSMWWLIGYQ